MSEDIDEWSAYNTDEADGVAQRDAIGGWAVLWRNKNCLSRLSGYKNETTELTCRIGEDVQKNLSMKSNYRVVGLIKEDLGHPLGLLIFISV